MPTSVCTWGFRAQSGGRKGRGVKGNARLGMAQKIAGGGGKTWYLLDLYLDGLR